MKVVKKCIQKGGDIGSFEYIQKGGDIDSFKKQVRDHVWNICNKGRIVQEGD